MSSHHKNLHIRDGGVAGSVPVSSILLASPYACVDAGFYGPRAPMVGIEPTRTDPAVSVAQIK